LAPGSLYDITLVIHMGSATCCGMGDLASAVIVTPFDAPPEPAPVPGPIVGAGLPGLIAAAGALRLVATAAKDRLRFRRNPHTSFAAPAIASPSVMGPLMPSLPE